MSQAVDVESAYSSSEFGEYAHQHACRFIDPRSPSMDINRTPIMVYEPVHTVDPRSPSEGIERTPITYQLPKNGMPYHTNTSPIMDKIPPLCFGDEMEESSSNEPNDSFMSTISEIDIDEEPKIEPMKVLSPEKIKTIPEEATLEIMPSPILPLIPNEHILETPKDDTPTVPNIISTMTATTTTTKFTDSLVFKSKIPTSQPSIKRAPVVLPSMIPQAVVKKKSDFQPTIKGFGWKKSSGGFLFPSSEGRSPLLNRNSDNNNKLPLSPFQPNVLGKIQPNYRQNQVMKGKSNVDVENALVRDEYNKENVTILWED